jgi:ESCRT-II complex subunit VPS25
MWSPPASVSSLWSFPPLFTLQPNQQTRDAQLAEWQKIVSAFCESSRPRVEVISLDDCPVWENRDLGRRLPPDGARAVADFMIRSRRAAFEVGSTTMLRVMWRSDDEWATLLHAFADRNGHVGGNVLLVGDLRAMVQEDFSGLEARTIVSALRKLAAQGRAQLSESADGDDYVGVIFR